MSKIELSAMVDLHYAGQRLDQVLAQVFPQHSRSRLQSWLKAGQILVDGKIWRAKDKVIGGEKIIVIAEIEADKHWQAQDLPLDIVYEDDAILVINKPAGLVVHPGAGNAKDTLLNALLNHAPQVAEVPRAGIVHRLDKDTTGLLVIAKTLAAHTSLVAQMQARTVKREYEAIAFGIMLSGGTLKTQMGRHPVDRKRMAVLTEGFGKEAITHIRVSERYRFHTLISVKLETGRTHQIRVHCAHLKFPLVGDNVYGKRLVIPKGASDELAEALRCFKRQALHAKRLTLQHPITGKTMQWQVKAPADYQHLLRLLREDAKLAIVDDDDYDDFGEYVDDSMIDDDE